MKARLNTSKNDIVLNRIDLGTNFGSSILLFISIIYIIIMASLHLFVFDFGEFKSAYYITAIVSLIGLLVIVFLFLKKSAICYLKGENLIVKYKLGHPKVMEKRCVRCMKTKHFFNASITHLRFKMDGHYFSAYLFGTRETEQNTTILLNSLRKAS